MQKDRSALGGEELLGQTVYRAAVRLQLLRDNQANLQLVFRVQMALRDNDKYITGVLIGKDFRYCGASWNDARHHARPHGKRLCGHPSL